MQGRSGLRILACALWCASTVHASTIWNEALNGDLSNSGLAPSAVATSVGSNVVIGSVGNSGAGIDRDYFTFTVPAGAALAAIKLLGNTSVSGGASFIAIQAGPRVTVSPNGAGVEQLLGFTHYGGGDIDSDLLPAMAIGFTGALASGTYSIWVQETGGPATYGLDFVIRSVDGGNLEGGDVPTLPEWAAILMALLLSTQIWRGNSRNKS